MAFILWIVWVVGLVFSLWLGYEIRNEKTKITDGQFLVLITLSIIVVGGIIVGKFAGMFFDAPGNSKNTMVDYILIIILTMIGMYITYMIGYTVLSLEDFDKLWQQIYFVVIFIVSVIGWTVFISGYNKNVEVVEQNVVASTEDRNLVYFCNVPVQSISGEISGSSILGTGGVSGSITTSDELSYWYTNENGDAFYDSANAQSSKIVFIGDDEKPYISIIGYETHRTTVDHNVNKERVETTGSWTQYVFYLPESIMQYNLG